MGVPGYKIVGPDGSSSAEFDSDALVYYARQGSILPGTYVYDPTLGSTLPAAQVPALQGVFPPYGAAPPAPGSYYPYRLQPQPANNRGAPVAIAIGSVIALLIVGALIFGAVKLMNAKQTVTSKDGRYAVSVPILWHERVASSANMVEYTYSGQGIGLEHLRPGPLTTDALDERAREDAQAMAARDGIAAPTQFVSMTVAGYPARQFTYDHDKGALFKKTYHYRHTFVLTPDGMYDLQVYASDDSGADPASQDAIINSFHAVH